MTGADLNSSAKPWSTQEATTEIVYREFHEQVNVCIEEQKALWIFCTTTTKIYSYFLWIMFCTMIFSFIQDVGTSHFYDWKRSLLLL
jgi:hypothetical protein